MSSEGMRRYWREVHRIADEEGVDVHEARDIWRERKPRRPSLDIKIDPSFNLTILEGDLGRRVLSPVCPFCRDTFDDDGFDVLSCEDCDTTYHDVCIEEFGGRCGTMGCGRLLFRPRRVMPTRPVAAALYEDHSWTRRFVTAVLWALFVTVMVGAGLGLFLWFVSLCRQLFNWFA